MKRETQFKTLGLSLVLIGFASCSITEDSPLPPEEDSKPIRFAVNTEYTRTGDITTNNLNKFYVYAYIGKGTAPMLFMENVEVTKTSNNTWEYSPVAYWPTKDSINFYAYAPLGFLGNASKPFQPVPYDASEGNQDVVYAVSPNMKGYQGQPNAQVVFNFRHALSKVTVKLSSTDTTLRVNVSNVVLTHIDTKGNFNFPQASTAEKPSTYNTGYWTDQNTPQVYILHMSQSAEDVVTLTTTPNDLSANGFGGSKYLIPQPLTWMSEGDKEDEYITVMGSIYDKRTGAKLWPNANTPQENIVEGSKFGDGLLKFPLATSQLAEWEPGHHYIYNLVINSNEDMGAIEFGTPTVDSFVEVETIYK